MLHAHERRQEDIAKTGTVLADENAPLADRFRAVFVLRNIGGEASIDALIGGEGGEGGARSRGAVSSFDLSQA